MKLSRLPIITIDCQTTGATPENGDLLEIGWQSLTPLQAIESRLHSVEIPRRISKLTGIDEVLLEEEGIEFKEIRNVLAKQLTTKTVFVAHFARFEKGFVEHLLERKFEFVCTHQIAKRLLDLPSYGIRAVAGYLGRPFEHELKRAREHVKATTLIWRRLLPILATEGVTTFAELNDFCSSAPLKRQGKRNFPLAKEKRLSLPKAPGIYRFKASNGKILYIGKARSLRDRVNSYFRGQKGRHSRQLEMLAQAVDVEITETATPLEAALLETDEIKRMNPPYNVALKESDRGVVYFDRAYSECSDRSSEEYCHGPFPKNELTRLLSLHEALKNKVFLPDILYLLSEEEVFLEGLKIFANNFERTPSTRQLLALALAQVRNDLKVEDELEETEEQEEVEEAEEAEFEWTPELVAQSMQKICKRSAYSLLRSKEIRSLANLKVAFKEKKDLDWRILKIEGATIKDRQTKPTMHGWRGIKLQVENRSLDLIDYDRLRVLLTELNGLVASGAEVRIEHP